jgi:uncharacterized membrane protein YgdD (TMEM256/DUF423 family)
MQRFNRSLGALAALMGAGGVMMAAAATHEAGGTMGQTAAYFLILHAAALLGVTACAAAAGETKFARALLVAGAGLGLGAIVFSADLGARAFSGARLFPMAAPIGGSLMIVFWLALAAVFVWGAVRGRS